MSGLAAIPHMFAILSNRQVREADRHAIFLFFVPFLTNGAEKGGSGSRLAQNPSGAGNRQVVLAPRLRS